MELSAYEALPLRSFEDVANEIQAGDLFLCSGNHFVSRIIKDGSKSQFSHVGLIFRWHDVPMLLEAVESDGVRSIPLSQYSKDYENSKMGYNGRMYLARFDGFTDAELAQMFTAAMGLMNKRFDTDGVVKAISRFYLGVGRDDEDDDYFCSEFVEACFKAAGISVENTLQGFVYPSHFAADPRVTGICELDPAVPYRE